MFCTEIVKQTYDYAAAMVVGCYGLKMDVYLPSEQRADRACVITLCGGGFADGNRQDEWSVKSAKALVEKGFVVISIDYQQGMQKEDIFKQNSSLFRLHYLFQYCIDLALYDLAKAIGYVYDNAAALNIDADRIILAGRSSGAIMALQLGYYLANQPRKLSDLPKWWRPAAVVAYSGAVLAEHFGFGYEYEPVPTLFFHGLEDKIVEPGKNFCSLKKSFFGSAALYEKMSEWKSSICWLFKVEGVGHEVSTLLPETADVFCGFVDHALSRVPSKMKVTIQDARIVSNEWTGKTFLDLIRENSQKMGLSK